MERSLTLKVISNESMGSRAKSMILDYQPNFLPGQVCLLSDPDGEKTEERLYSIASAPGERLEIIYNRIDEGYLSPLLWDKTPNDSVLLHGIQGNFYEKKSLGNDVIVWIAAGTGIAPFVSMVRSSQDFNKHLLVQGAKVSSELYYSSLFKSVAASSSPWGTEQNVKIALDYQDPALAMEAFKEQGRFSYLPCLSQEDSGNGFAMKITDFVETYIPIEPNWQYMICGSNSLVITIQEILLAKGADYRSLVAEVYF